MANGAMPVKPWTWRRDNRAWRELLRRGGLQSLVRAVAQRWTLGLFASAEINGFGFGRFPLERCHSRTFSAVCTVAEWLFLGSATGAPKIGFAGFDVDWHWLAGCYGGFTAH